MLGRDVLVAELAISFSAPGRTATRVEDGRASAASPSASAAPRPPRWRRRRSRRRRRRASAGSGRRGRPPVEQRDAAGGPGRPRGCAARRPALRGGDGFLGLDREAIRLHQPSLRSSFASSSSIRLRSRSSSARSFCDLRFQRQHRLDAGQVQPFGGHLLDPPQPLDVALRVEAGVLRRALRLDQPARLVHPQRLRVHLGELGGDRDHEDAPLLVDRRVAFARAPVSVGHHARSPRRLPQQLGPRVGAVERLGELLDRLAPAPR